VKAGHAQSDSHSSGSLDFFFSRTRKFGLAVEMSARAIFFVTTAGIS